MMLSATSVRTASHDQLTNFLETGEMEPAQPTVSNYDTQSGGILEVLQNMQTETAEKLRDVQHEESERVRQYQLLAQDYTNKKEASKKAGDEAVTDKLKKNLENISGNYSARCEGKFWYIYRP